MRVNQEIQPKTKIYPKVKKEACLHSSIDRLQVKEEKITAFLTDKREISIPTNWLTDKTVSLSQLQNYQIWDGLEIYWPELKEMVGVETFTNGLGACCDYH